MAGHVLFRTGIRRFVGKAVMYLIEDPRYGSQDRKDTINTLVDAFAEVVRPAPALEPYRGTRRQRAGLRSYTAAWINAYINAVELVPGEPPGKQVQIRGAARDQVNILKQLTRVYVIENPALETQQYGQRRIVRELFEIDTGILDSGDDMGVFPPSHREDIETTDEYEERIRIVADLISSMTEQQLLKTHQRLTGLSPSSVMDVI